MKTLLTVALIVAAVAALAWRGHRSAQRADEAHRNLLRLAAEQAQDDEQARDDAAIAANLDI